MFYALLKAIENGTIIKAGLDVLEWEKIDDLSANQAQLLDDLKNTGKVIFTPHIAGWTFESYRRINEVLTKKIAEFLDQYNNLK